MEESILISECFGLWGLYFIFQLLEEAGSSDDELDTNIDDVIEFIGDTLPVLFANMQKSSHQDESQSPKIPPSVLQMLEKVVWNGQKPRKSLR